MAFRSIILVVLLTIYRSTSWQIPQIPSGHRAQYLFLHGDGGYKYGYDTVDAFAKQSGDSSNQVEGHYFYKNNKGQNVDLKYTAGVQGFVPEGYEKVLARTSEDFVDDQANTGDASYAFNIDTDTYKRQETSDARGNIQGRYSYSNEAGVHDLTYIAGENTGFVATSGTLSRANGLQVQGYPVIPSSPQQRSSFENQINNGGVYGAVSNSENVAKTAVVPSGNDASYSFGFSTDSQSRQETADSSGTVRGSYSFRNSEGNHDLSYVAGADTGFLPTGGSLAVPNGLVPSQYSNTANGAAAGVHVAGAATGFVPTGGSPSSPNGASPIITKQSSSNPDDASYSFSIDTDEYKRHETSDANGNIQGSYSYKNSVGNHDLTFVAGAATGFLPTGGSLRVAPGVTEAQLRQGQTLMRSSPAIQDYSPIQGSGVIAKSAILTPNNFVVRTYLPPGNGENKYGYIYQTI